jgi:hypothetical protein
MKINGNSNSNEADKFVSGMAHNYSHVGIAEIFKNLNTNFKGQTFETIKKIGHLGHNKWDMFVIFSIVVQIFQCNEGCCQRPVKSHFKLSASPQLSQFIYVKNLIKHATAGQDVNVRHHFILFSLHSFAPGSQDSIY